MPACRTGSQAVGWYACPTAIAGDGLALARRPVGSVAIVEVAARPGVEAPADENRERDRGARRSVAEKAISQARAMVPPDDLADLDAARRSRVSVTGSR